MERERRKWTNEEDARLEEAVRKTTRESRPLLWREVAKNVPGRTNKDCRRRWCNTLANGMMKGPWTESEDERLCNAVRDHGSKWTQVAAVVGTRNPDQCSSHWSQTLNPDIDYSDWTRLEDTKLLDAVQRYGTNWTKIVSTHLPNRTALALKNRFSALSTKSCQAGTTVKNKSAPKRKHCRSGALENLGRSNRNDSSLAAADGGEADGHINDDDEDEDDNQGHDSNEAIMGTFLDMDWQESPVYTGAAERHVSFTQATNPPSLCSPAQSDTQQSFNRSSAAIEQWHKEVQDPTIYSSTFPFDFVPNSSSNINSNTSVLSGIDTDHTTSSASLYPHQHSSQSHVPLTALPAHDLTASPRLEIHRNRGNYTLPKERVSPPMSHNTSPLSSQGSSGHGPTMQQYHSPSQHLSLIDREPAAQDQSPIYAQGSGMPPPSAPSLGSVSSSSTDDILHHVYIDAVCTNEQLGNVMSTLVGLAKSVTVRVRS